MRGAVPYRAGPRCPNHPGEQKGRVDRGQLALPDTATGLHVQEVVVEASVARCIRLRPLRAVAEEAQRSKRNLGGELAALVSAPRMFGDGFEQSTILRTGPDGLTRVVARLQSWKALPKTRRNGSSVGSRKPTARRRLRERAADGRQIPKEERLRGAGRGPPLWRLSLCSFAGEPGRVR